MHISLYEKLMFFRVAVDRFYISEIDNYLNLPENTCILVLNIISGTGFAVAYPCRFRVF